MLLDTVCSLIALGQTSGSSGVWSAVTKNVQDNPTLALLALLLGAFLGGFGVRKFFEDREISKLRLMLEESRKELRSLAGSSEESEAKAEANAQLAERLRKFLSPEELQSSLAKHLAEFPAEKHEALLAALMRQLLIVPGHAWLCTPKATVLIRADFDEEKGASQIRVEVNLADDPLREFRAAITNEEQLAAAMLQLSLNGIARVAVAVSVEQRKHLTAMQGPGMNWSHSTELLQRIDRQ